MNWSEETILVTGGTGSFGSKFTEIILRECAPRRLILFSSRKLKQQQMRAAGFDHPKLTYITGDVRDFQSVEAAMEGVTIVVHAAGLKDVPACESAPWEAIQTNVVGAHHVIEAAIQHRVQKVLALSTDKAADPANLYGATKLCAERMFVQANGQQGAVQTRFSCSRYGNVLGSKGSVLSVFLEHKRDGKIRVTDPRMTRFCVTPEQSVRFVARCIDRMEGGEIFVYKSPSMRLLDLATALAPGCKVQYVGLRRGEKLHEVLLTINEARHAVEIGDTYLIQLTSRNCVANQLTCGGQLPEGFYYSSDTNSDWLSVRELKELVTTCALAPLGA